MRNDLLDRLAWRIHHDAFDKARKEGADFHASTRAGFAATRALASAPEVSAHKVVDSAGV